MKITTQSADELVLTEGSASGIFVGVVAVLAGIGVAIFLRAQTQYAPWIGLAAIALGIGIILMSSSITIRANRKTGQLYHEKKRLVGTKSATYAIADIFRIETRKEWRVQNATPNQGTQVQQPQLVAQSVIVFRDGRQLALDHQKNAAQFGVGGATVMGGQGAETALAAHLAQFIKVPFEEIAPPNMGIGLNIIG